jgi:hypothetical protein
VSRLEDYGRFVIEHGSGCPAGMAAEELVAADTRLSQPVRFQLFAVAMEFAGLMGNRHPCKTACPDPPQTCESDGQTWVREGFVRRPKRDHQVTPARRLLYR